MDLNAAIERLAGIVGEAACVTDEADQAPYLHEWRGTWVGKAAAVVRPASTEDVAAVVRTCADAGIAIVPQGGNTGLCGGAIPDATGTQVVLSLGRLNRIRTVDPTDFSMTVEAGAILADVQRAAEDADRLFALSLAAEGSCQIGGNLSTNAGGTNVLRYGTAREQVLGLEVVLADGAIWDGLRRLRKDTAGYDLKQLFIGSEGTLGVITAATLKLHPLPKNRQVALLSLPSASAAVDLYASLRESLADQLQAFEMMPDIALAMVRRHLPDIRIPANNEAPWYALIETAQTEGQPALDDTLAAALDEGRVSDAVIAKNRAEADNIWRMRHAISEAQKHEGASLKHDVSVATGDVADFIDAATRAVLRIVPGARIVAFGHIGDGNVHFNVSQPAAMEPARFLELRERVAVAVYEVVAEFSGSISAEHGVGVLKRHHLERFRGSIDVRLMRTLKQALDPKNLLNPGKVLD